MRAAKVCSFDVSNFYSAVCKYLGLRDRAALSALPSLHSGAC